MVVTIKNKKTNLFPFPKNNSIFRLKNLNKHSVNLTLFFLVAKDYLLPCLSKQLLGMDCPGCGIQRSVFLLFEGEFLAAFKMYPAIYPILGLFGFLILDQFFKIKYVNNIIISLMILSVLFILINFLLKII